MEPSAVRDALDYDQETGVMVWRSISPYHKGKIGAEAGTVTPSNRDKCYHNITICGRKYKRSRLAFAWMTGRWPEHQIDHINGNSLDDRWSNLREATPLQNAWNHKRRAKKSALPMGVRSNPSGRYSARLAVDKRMIQIGTFDTIEDAERAYAEARERYYGQFA